MVSDLIDPQEFRYALGHYASGITIAGALVNEDSGGLHLPIFLQRFNQSAVDLILRDRNIDELAKNSRGWKILDKCTFVGSERAVQQIFSPGC